ncbi:MAG: hypothetical protein E6Q96_00065 [Cyclobacteriaceae bacterium]|nr:MAG: hypothetical protein E6Q96_00065 [Cyclobacteriaceae bacterium]
MIDIDLNPPAIVTSNNEESRLSKYDKMFFIASFPVRINNLFAFENRLNSFKRLSDGWDGYAATTPDNIVISNSIKFLEALPEYLADNLKEDDITPTPYGTIVIDWQNDRSEKMSVEIGNQTLGFFSRFEDNDCPKINRVDFNENSLPEELFKSFKKLFKN